MDKSMEARIRMQEEAKVAVREAGYNASVVVTVGGGKGKIMIDLLKELISLGKVKTVLYLCDNRRLRDSETDGFPAELNKWGTEEIRKMVRIECYQTACKWVGQEFDLLLADEVDYAITPVYVKAMLNNKYKYKVLLTGTLSVDKKLVLQKIAPIVYRFSVIDAEGAGVVNKTVYYIYNFKMNEDEIKQYKTMTRKITALTRAGVQFGDRDMDFWTRKRKHFLAALDSSKAHCDNIMNSIRKSKQQNRTVIFCELRSQADRVCKYSFHGENEADDNLSRFQTGEINELSVVAKIKRGINLKKANIAIFEGCSSSSTEWEQRNGRFKRLGIDEVATVIFMVPWYLEDDKEDGQPYWKETVVRKWIDKATSNIHNISFKTLKV